MNFQVVPRSRRGRPVEVAVTVGSMQSVVYSNRVAVCDSTAFYGVEPIFSDLFPRSLSSSIGHLYCSSFFSLQELYKNFPFLFFDSLP